MEMKIGFVESAEKQRINGKNQRKWDCVYYHTDKICEKVLANRKCDEGRWCQDPKD